MAENKFGSSFTWELHRKLMAALKYKCRTKTKVTHMTSITSPHHDDDADTYLFYLESWGRSEEIQGSL
jgi:hypothetical protein